MKAVLFDIDGTLLDTRQFIFKAFEYSSLINYQKVISLDDLNPLAGKPLTYCYQQLLPNGDIATLCQSHHNFQLQNLHLAIPFKGSKPTLKKLKQRNIKVGTITNRFGNTVMKTLELADLANYVDVVITGDDVKKPKPDKEPLVKALRILGIKSSEALFVGDTDVDILTGKNARVKTVGVTYGFLGQDIKKYYPDYLINNIEDLLNIV